MKNKAGTLSVHIVFDEEKILREGKYDLEKMKEYVKRRYLKYDTVRFKEDGKTYVFYSTNDSLDFGRLGLANVDLGEQDWFRENVKSFIWRNKAYGDEYKEDIFLGIDRDRERERIAERRI